MAAPIYNTQLWKAVRDAALARDDHTCTIGRLLGGPCSPDRVPLHAHHIVPVDEGGAAYDLDNLGTSCARHHPQWESLRRVLARRHQERPAVCPHPHRSRDSREICETRLARQRDRVV